MKVAILFHRLGPYHHARLAAAAARLTIQVIEFSRIDRTYAWDIESSARAYPITTLFADKDVDEMDSARIARQMHLALLVSKPDVVAIPGWSSPASLAALDWCFRNRKPAVIMSASTRDDEPRKAWREFIKKKIVMFGSAGLVGGRLHREYMAALGLPQERIFVGYDVVDNKYFSSLSDVVQRDSENLRAQFHLPKHYFLASSRFIEKKNLPRMLEAFARYRRLVGKDAWSLVIIGDGPLRATLEAKINQLGLSQCVLMPGFIQYGELPYYYLLASAFVHASTSEQWGLVVNEAMAAGLPVLVSENCGCAIDLIDQGRNGCRFDPYDVNALASLLQFIASSQCDRAAMGQASREKIDRWTPEVFAVSLAQAAESALLAANPKVTFVNRVLLWAVMKR